MNISALNSINYTSFTANKAPNKSSIKPTNVAKQATKQPVKQQAKQLNNQGYAPKFAKKTQVPTKLIAALLAIGVTTGGMITLVRNNNKEDVTETTPTTSYTEEYETQAAIETEETQPVIKTPSFNMVDSLPINMREDDKFHTVKAGEKLTDIVIEYAELDENYPYEGMIPYFERLMYENPGKIKRVDRESGSDKYQALPEYILLKDVTLRVDGILPENIISGNVGVGDEPEEPKEPTPTAPIQITSPEDTVFAANRDFCFDLGTMNKNIFGDCDGLMYGDYAVLNKKMDGSAELTMYDGINANSNKISTTAFDKDGKIIEVIKYEDNKPASVSTYTYKMDTVTEKTVDKNAGRGEIDTVTTVRDYSNNILSREFLDGSNSVALFNFETSQVRIGEETWELEAGTFVCDDSVIGADRYAAVYNGALIKFDIVKNGASVEYYNIYDELVAREHFDAKGNLIFEE